MKSIWKRLHDIYKDAVNEENDFKGGFYIIPCDECMHFGSCKYEKQCNENVHLGRGLKHFEEKE